MFGNFTDKFKYCLIYDYEKEVILMYDVICMGSATIDLFTKIGRNFEDCKAGEKILINDLDYETGGGGTNSAVALKRLGCRTAYLGKFGDDHNGEKIKKELNKEKVKILPVKASSKSSSFSVVMESDKEKDRIIYAYKGASNDLGIDDFKLNKINPKWLYIASLMGKSLTTCKKVVEHAHNKGTKILFNPSEYLAKKHDVIKPILKRTELLVFNKREAQLLTNTNNDFRELSKEILAMGVNRVIITNGSNKLFYADKEFHCTAYPLKIKPVSTAGSGDAFTSGFLAGQIKGYNVENSLKIGILNSASVIKHLGTKNKLLRWQEVKSSLNKKITIK